MEDGPSTVITESASTPVPAGGEAPSSAASTPAEAQDVSGRSSPAVPGETVKAESRESLLDVVRKAAPQREKQPGPGDERGVSRSGESAPPSAQSKEDLGPLTQAEMDAFSPRSRRRIDAYREEIKGLKAQIPQLEAQAKTTVELQNFLKQTDIAKEDFGRLLDLGAAVRRGDWRSFLEGVGPYVKLAQESLGIQLPADLQQAVAGGHMTQDAARYTAQVRAQQQLAQSQLTRVTQETSQRDQAEAVQQFQASVAGAVANWETGVRRSDPDYARKEPVVQKLVHAVVAERGPPRSPAEAVEIAKQAYEQANALVSRFNPNVQRSTHQVPSSINRVNGARVEPKSLKEAIHYAIERTR